MANDRARRPFILQWRAAVLNSTLPATAKLCLIVLSEFADADGSNCYPSIEMVARKASINEKTARLNLAEAANTGWIERVSRGTKQGWKRFEYTPIVPKGADTTPARIPEGAGVTPGAIEETSGHHAQKVRASRPEGAGVTPDDLAITYPIPREEKHPLPAKRSSKSKGITYAEWNSTKAEGEVLIPPDHHVFRYAERAGIPADFLDLAWEVFCVRYRTDAKARYTDWPGHFRKAVEGNWYSLWWIDGEGQYQLTTKGKQADIFHKTEIQSTTAARSEPWSHAI
ncbi:MAG: helix-turn-helix domain-containing protein [Lysobacter sp.]